MNINIILRLVLVLVSVLAFSCGKTQEIREFETGLNALSQLNGEDLVSKSEDIITNIIIYEQELQAKNPKKLDIELLEKAEALFVSLIEKHNEMKDNIIIGVNYATLNMLIASYYNSKSDIMKASESVEQGSYFFNKLAKVHPQNIIVRAYRGLNYSYLPEIFGKQEIINSDYETVISLVMEASEYTLYEQSMLKIFFTRGLEYYADNAEMVERINAAFEKVN